MAPLWSGDGQPTFIRVLQVDDSSADQLMVRRALERDPNMRWALEQVSTAEEGLERATTFLPDLVLMDFHLPGMTGLDLLRALRERNSGRVLAAVVLTGTGNERVAVEAMKAGAQDYLLKGAFSPERLRHSLHAALETVRMERALEERRLKAERAEQAAREALAVRDELFALATHDLKGPLQIITLNAQLMRGRLPLEARSPEVDARLSSITRAAMRMGELIDHFLLATRGHEQPLHRDRMDLLVLVRAKVSELEHTTSRHTFSLQVLGKDFEGFWDAAGLERVLDNLLGNAMKYSPEGGHITVTLAEESPGPEGQVRLSVEDQGVGIPQGDLPHVFERFHRGRNVAGTISGTGVGLASALRIVELHGGSLHVESEEGRGSAFTLRLPRELTRGASKALQHSSPLEGSP